MTSTELAGYSRVRRVGSFQELLATPLAGGVNALCWERSLAGDFCEVARALGPGEGIVAIDEDALQSLTVSAAGRAAIEVMQADQRLLRDHGLSPELNIIHAYPRDEEAEGIPTDVFSYHADSAPVPTDTWLCTYFGATSEGLLNEEAQRRVDVPETRAALLRLFGGAEGVDFEEFLRDRCYDLHYAPLPGGAALRFWDRQSLAHRLRDARKSRPALRSPGARNQTRRRAVDDDQLRVRTSRGR